MNANGCADRIVRMPESGIREVFDKAAQYDDIADLSIGEPDFTTPEPIIDAVDERVRAGATHYTPTAGRSDLRESLSRKLARENDISVDPESEVLVTPGAMGALFESIHSLVDPGDEVVIPEPFWPNYHGHVASAGGTIVPVETDRKDGFVPSPDRIADAITADTKLLVLNTPSNPTGAVIPQATLERIASVVDEADIWCLVDETYESLVYDDREHYSIASDPALFDRTVTVHSFSKAYAMTGWRVGYVSGPSHIIDSIRVLQEHTVSSVAEPAQVAAMAALESPELLEEIRETFDRRRTLMVDRLGSVPGLSPVDPAGAFYVFAELTGTELDSRSVVMRLLEDEQVAVVPGSVFGESAESFLRLSYATNEATIEDGTDRMRRVFESFSA
ncbi:pyridoxal phosphate-dependent aminotransferase [Natrarchaeobius halalkaliphilus]|uniref:Aminotransferase n=1 Tax=Natrarchaeobius halalkaliphilus TaxID=1679091 RepID=A0A3N6M0H4_9EURY|nr:pyridoxal phosphate-dependent aminotransferase [Natrarchaeobius halalkaliphilus]RQG88054.1 pyridoxal phosphate-dependent aminotransferase [Natrarchaeobius halalkaliphilus]